MQVHAGAHSMPTDPSKQVQWPVCPALSAPASRYKGLLVFTWVMKSLKF